MRSWCDAAGLPECTSHGLRKACARRLAEAGATPNEIAAITGHATLKEVERYTRDASRAMMADSGMAKVLTNHPARFVKNRQLPEMKG
jgi:integrase